MTEDSPLTGYQHRIAHGELSADSAQYNAIEQLDALFQQLMAHRQRGNWLQRRFKANSPPPGYYLWGGVGTGKTVLMDMFYQSLPQGFGERIHFHRFMQFVHDRKHEIKNRPDPLGIIATDFATRIKVLCLDEFSVTDITDAMILSRLLTHFFSRGVVLVTTSNIEIDNLYLNGLQRQQFLPAIVLLKKHTTALHIDSGNDYRMAYLQDEAIFHTPAGQQADAEMMTCFNRLTGKKATAKADDKAAERASTASSAVPIFGREIDVVASGLGVVWFEFQALCQTNRSTSDYIEIAKQFHTILLSNIPQLTAMHDDAARRLIELVDELYDRNVNLIASSAQPPAKIYSGKRLAAPFKRTASRLIEMSSCDYLSKPHLS